MLQIDSVLPCISTQVTTMVHIWQLALCHFHTWRQQDVYIFVVQYMHQFEHV